MCIYKLPIISENFQFSYQFQIPLVSKETQIYLYIKKSIILENLHLENWRHICTCPWVRWIADTWSVLSWSLEIGGMKGFPKGNKQMHAHVMTKTFQCHEKQSETK